MAKKTVFLVGRTVPEIDGLRCLQFNSDLSLLDADVIAIRPELSKIESDEKHDGRPLVDLEKSRKLKELFRHWRSQTLTALESGKTVIVFISPRNEFSMYGDLRRGTWEKLRTDNYHLVPIQFENLVAGKGRAMKLARNAEVVARYWQAFSDDSIYHVHFGVRGSEPLVTTKVGDKVVGVLIRGKGTLVCLPDLDWDRYIAIRKDEKVDDWPKRIEEFCYKLRDGLLNIDAALRPDVEEVPEPQWAGEASYKLEIEADLEKKISEIAAQLDSLMSEREELRSAMKRHASLRMLLFGTGKPLEAAVRYALRVLGFQAESYADADSEFDIVFTSEEGRFLGEAEGRDTKSIDVAKYSQLQRNIHEDFQKAETSELAKGVLFGNAHRVYPPSERKEFFTLKVLNGAKQTGCALVRTPDLFTIARFLTDHPDDEFAAKCRQAIAAASGVVEFP